MVNETSTSARLGKCFVIMPFSPTTDDHTKLYWTKFFNKYLVPTLSELGYDCVRSDAGPNNLVAHIVHDLFTSDIVLAILTDFNPNVMYELGVRHSIGSGTIMAIERGTYKKFPFDLAHFGFIEYDDHNRKAFKDMMAHYLSLIRMRDRIDSPVAEYFTATGREMRLVRMARSVVGTPLSHERMLLYAQKNLFLIGQNLYALAKDNNIRDKIFDALQSRPSFSVRIMIVDPQQRELVQAISQVVDPTMEKDLREVIKLFITWRDTWLSSNPTSPSRFEIKLSDRIGNVSFTFADYDTRGGLALIRPTLYRTPPAARPCFLLSSRDASDVFEAYVDVFNEAWNIARPLESMEA